MVATTRLRTLLQKSAPVQLAKISSSKTKSRRRLCAFVSKTSNKGVYKKAYRGVTKRLDLKLFSKGSLPRAKLHTRGSVVGKARIQADVEVRQSIIN